MRDLLEIGAAEAGVSVETLRTALVRIASEMSSRSVETSLGSNDYVGEAVVHPDRFGMTSDMAEALRADLARRYSDEAETVRQVARYWPDVVLAEQAGCPHRWPDEITPDAMCPDCGLRYAEWADSRTR